MNNDAFASAIIVAIQLLTRLPMKRGERPTVSSLNFKLNYLGIKLYHFNIKKEIWASALPY